MKNIMQQMMKDAIKMQKEILNENEDDLKEISATQANIEKAAIEIKAAAVKEGLTKDNIYCKYCGSLIDEDSIYCKKCGKKVI